MLCNLSVKHNALQVPLDLQFAEGSKVTFFLKGGEGMVHLSGYNLLDDELDSFAQEEGEEEEEEDDDESEG